MSLENTPHSGPRQPTTQFLTFDTGVAAYDGNVCIGALGKIPTDDEIEKTLTSEIKFKPSERTLPPEIRMHCVRRLTGFNMPTNEQKQVCRTIGIMMREGYLHRNPLDPQFRRLWLEDKERIDRGEMPPERFDTLPSLGLCISGGAGNGKTVAAGYALSPYPVLFEHLYTIGDVTRSFYQVPYIKMDLAADASLKELAIEFFIKLGGRVGRDLRAEWRIDACNENSVQPKIYAACRQYNVGMIVVDEAQNLSRHRKGHAHVVHYFVHLMNCIGVPIVLIGSNTLGSLIGSAMELGRRFTEYVPEFRPFAAGPLWNEFITRLCEKHYVNGRVDFDGRSKLFHELTGGIPDLAVKLFIFAQTRVFGRTKDGQPDENITADVLNETAGLLFHFVQNGIKTAKLIPKGEEALAAALASVSIEYRQRINAECVRVGAAPMYPTPVKPVLEVAESIPSVSAGVEATPTWASGRTPRRNAPAKPRHNGTLPSAIKAELASLGLRGGAK